MAILALDPQEALLQSAALEKVIELALHVVWQREATLIDSAGKGRWSIGSLYSSRLCSQCRQSAWCRFGMSRGPGGRR